MPLLLSPPGTNFTRPDSSARSVYVDSAGFSDPNTAQQQQLQQQQQEYLLEQRRHWRPELPTDFQKLAQQSTGEMLPIFGRELFLTPPSTFAPADQLPASPDYVLGPGDEVILRIWGHDTFNSRLTVDRAGAIYIPHLGSVDVAGLRFGDLHDHLNQELSRTYRNFELSVNLGKLRSIQVFVLGEAYSPGSYTLSSLSTIFNALLTSGGPTPQGSLRNVQLRRGPQTIATLDLYDFILKGDRSKDLILQSGDVIYIPFVGAQVAVAGSVRHPAIYEILPSTNLNDLLKQAGNLSATASDAHVSIERIADRHERRAMTVQLDAAGIATPLMDGDVVRVDPILDGYKDSVMIRGNLANPGRFPWHSGMRLSDIIPDRESLLTADYWRQRNRLGLPTPLFEPSYRADCANRQPQRPDTEHQGSGNAYDSCAFYDANGYETGMPAAGQMSTGDGGAQSGESPGNGLDAQDTPTKQKAQLGQSALGEQQARTTRNLTSLGRRTDIKLSAPEIDWSYAVIQRLDAKTLRNSLIPFDLGKLVDGRDAAQNTELQPGDVVTILSQEDILVRQDEQTKYVRLEGEFVNSGVYSVAPGETLVDVVRRAGGLTDKAYLYGSSFTRESARVLQQQRLGEYITSLSENMQRAALTRSLSAATAGAASGQYADQRTMLEEMRKLRATGRVVLQFKPGSVGEGPIPSIGLEDGDTFRVPPRPIIVSVVGSVHGQNVFLYNDRYRVRDYLHQAGGPSRFADLRHAFVIHADGSVYSDESGRGLWSHRLGEAEINPGDTVVVPEKPISPSVLREVIDWSQVFSQFAVGAAAINLLK